MALFDWNQNAIVNGPLLPESGPNEVFSITLEVGAVVAPRATDPVPDVPGGGGGGGGGVSVMVAVPVVDVLAWLVAVKVTVCVELMLDGDVYNPPLVTVPAPVAGESDQVTTVLLDPITVALNCCVCPGPSDTVDGETETLTVVCPPT